MRCRREKIRFTFFSFPPRIESSESQSVILPWRGNDTERRATEMDASGMNPATAQAFEGMMQHKQASHIVPYFVHSIQTPPHLIRPLLFQSMPYSSKSTLIKSTNSNSIHPHSIAVI